MAEPTYIITSSPYSTLQITLGILHSVGLDKGIMHVSIIIVSQIIPIHHFPTSLGTSDLFYLHSFVTLFLLKVNLKIISRMKKDPNKNVYRMP